MSTAYTSTRYPTAYRPSLYSNIQNGSQALATTVHNIAENQHWLVMADLDVVNFHQSWATDEWTNSTRVLQMLVPPFCQFAGFHFYVARDFDVASLSSPVTANGIRVTSAVDTRTVHNVGFGEDITESGKGGFDNGAYGWVHIDTIVEHPQTDDQSALKLAAATSETWTTVEFSVIMGSKVRCRAAAYHIIPNRTGYIVTV